MRRHLHAFQILANVRRAGMKKACTSHSPHICVHIAGMRCQGALCIASDGYAGFRPIDFTFSSALLSFVVPGPCAAEQDLAGKSIEQKLAFANACSASFPCQALASHGHGFASGRYLSLAAQEECAQDFQQACPRCVRLRVAIVFQT